MSSGVVEVSLYTLFLFIKVCRDSVVMCCCRRDSVVLCCCCRVVLAGARLCVEIRLWFSWSCRGWCVLARPCDVSDNGLVGIVGVLFFPLFQKIFIRELFSFGITRDVFMVVRRRSRYFRPSGFFKRHWCPFGCGLKVFYNRQTHVYSCTVCNVSFEVLPDC